MTFPGRFGPLIGALRAQEALWERSGALAARRAMFGRNAARGRISALAPRSSQDALCQLSRTAPQSAAVAFHLSVSGRFLNLFSIQGRSDFELLLARRLDRYLIVVWFFLLALHFCNFHYLANR